MRREQLNWYSMPASGTSWPPLIEAPGLDDLGRAAVLVDQLQAPAVRITQVDVGAAGGFDQVGAALGLDALADDIVVGLLGRWRP